jgi:hypothetical protein
VRVNIDVLTDQEFAELPLVIKGESKEVRYAGNGQVVIRFLPTIYSFTANRCGVVPGSEVLRLRASKIFLEVLRKAGIKHAYQEVNDRFVLATLVLPHTAEFAKYNTPVFVPSDLSEREIDALPKAPPIEVIVKWYHGGTSKHEYIGMCGAEVRANHPLYAGMLIEAEGAYPAPIIRFDWRNPLNQPGRGKRTVEQILTADMLALISKDSEAGKLTSLISERLEAFADRTADKPLPEDIADLFIDVKRARATVLHLRNTLQNFLAERDIICNDLCLFVADDGETVYGEISQDCGRYRHFDLGSLDKDVWRTGGSSEMVLAKWQILLDCIGGTNP